MAQFIPILGAILSGIGQNQTNHANTQAQTSNQAAAEQFLAEMLNKAGSNQQAASGAAFGNLAGWEKANPAPVQGWGNIKGPTQFGNGATVGGGTQRGGPLGARLGISPAALQHPTAPAPPVAAPGPPQPPPTMPVATAPPPTQAPTLPPLPGQRPIPGPGGGAQPQDFRSMLMARLAAGS